MQYCFIILTTIAFFSCNNNDRKEKEIVLTKQSNYSQSLVDSFDTYNYQSDFKDKNIINKSDKNVDLLFNGIDRYFGGQHNPNVRFRTECIGCLSIQEYRGGLLFGKKLFITSDNIKYYKNNINIPDTINRISTYSDGRERTNPKFNFTGGTGSIKFFGISCNDADFNKVKLTYTSGHIVVDSLINAAFFEYDLDANGVPEQYLLGSRNCSQELAILRISK